MGCLPFSKKKIQEFRLKVKWNSNFPENPFGNCRLSPEVVLFFRSERSGGNSITICFIFQFSRNRIANGKRHLGRLICCFWEKPLPLFNGHPSWFILTNCAPMYSLLLLNAPDKERSRIGSTSDAKILKTTNFTEFFTTNPAS